MLNIITSFHIHWENDLLLVWNDCYSFSFHSSLTCIQSIFKLSSVFFLSLQIRSHIEVADLQWYWGCKRVNRHATHKHLCSLSPLSQPQQLYESGYWLFFNSVCHPQVLASAISLLVCVHPSKIDALAVYHREIKCSTDLLLKTWCRSKQVLEPLLNSDHAFSTIHMIHSWI